jgi:predicted nucleotidyltransferase
MIGYNAQAVLIEPRAVSSGTGGRTRDHGESEEEAVACSLVAATATAKVLVLGTVAPDCYHCRLRTSLLPRADWRVRVLLSGTDEEWHTYRVISATKGLGHWHLFVEREA